MSKLQKQQELNLKKLVQQGGKTSLYAHLGLVGLKKYKDFDLLHQSYAQETPVHTVTSFQKMLTDMTHASAEGEAGIVSTLVQKNLMTTKPLAGLCYWKNGIVPVSKDILNSYYSYEKEVFSNLARQGIKPKGQVFSLFEREKGYRHGSSGLSVTGWNRLIQENRSMFGRQKYLPLPEHLENATGSRFQWFNAMLETLKKHGRGVETLIAHPATLVDFALFTAQQEGRFVPLSDLCPNLKVYLFSSNTLSLYRTELSYFFKGLSDARWVQFYHNPAGVFAYQQDVNIREQLTLYPHTDAFFEFVPEEDVQADGGFKKGFRRLHLNQVQEKRRYSLLASNSSGMVSVDFKQLVFIKSTDPLRVTLVGNPRRLNTLNEGLFEYDISTTIDGINTALAGQGLFIRNFLFGSDYGRRQPKWILELSRPVENFDEKLLHSIADRLKSELVLKNPRFREFTQNPNIQPIEVCFVPMGTLASVAGEGRLPKFDTDLRLPLISKVLDGAWMVRTIRLELVV